MFTCEYCGKELTTKSVLRNHQEKAKYCLEKQNKTIRHEIKCSFCNKEFSAKNRKETHEAKCPHRIEKERLELLVLKEIDTDHKSLREDYKTLETTHKTLSDNYKTLSDNYKTLDTKHNSLSEDNKTLSTKIASLLEENISLKLEKQRADIYSELYNKEQIFVHEQSKRLVEKSGVTTTNIKAKNITMNALNLSQERLESIKDTYTIKHYERGGIGQADWVVDNVLRDESGNLIYKCTDKNRKNFIYHDNKGDVVTDIQAKKLKEAILPIMSTKLKEFKKIKCAELAEQSDDESELLEQYSNLYNENKSMGNEFDKRLVEKTYDRS
ncbi:MAG: hypothetical protein PHG66_00120 [Candidatus Colwellbacteria bacterium]|nr:hypothetical protein [Candidatus Colwellbacteria bacterium]